MALKFRDVQFGDKVIARGFLREQAKLENDFPLDFFPETGLVIIEEIEELEVIKAVLFVYLDRTSPVAMAGQFIANPANRYGETHQAFVLAFRMLEYSLKRYNVKHITTQFGKKSLNNIIQKYGYQKADDSQQFYKKMEV